MLQILRPIPFPRRTFSKPVNLVLCAKLSSEEVMWCIAPECGYNLESIKLSGVASIVVGDQSWGEKS